MCRLALNFKVFGEVYAAPILTISTEAIRGQVEEELAQKEWELKTKKKEDKAKKGQKLQAAQGGVQAIPVDDDVWEIPSEDEPVGEPAAKVAKKGTDKEDNKAAKEALKQEKLVEAAWQKETGKAARVIAQLTSATHALLNSKQRAGNNAELFNDTLLAGIDDAYAKLKSLKDRSMSENLRISFFLLQRCGRFIFSHCPWVASFHTNIRLV